MAKPVSRSNYREKGKLDREKVEAGGNSGHPERDQFIEGKIGSGYMSTIAGQPNLRDYAEVKGGGGQIKKKGVNEKTPGPVEH